MSRAFGAAWVTREQGWAAVESPDLSAAIWFGDSAVGTVSASAASLAMIGGRSTRRYAR
jgi:hypothetical protein